MIRRYYFIIRVELTFFNFEFNLFLTMERLIDLNVEVIRKVQGNPHMVVNSSSKAAINKEHLVASKHFNCSFEAFIVKEDNYKAFDSYHNN